MIIFRVDISSSPHIDNKVFPLLYPLYKGIGKGPTQRLGKYSISTEKMGYINFIMTRKKFCLSLHYNGANSHLLFHGAELKFKAKDSEIVSTPLCLRIITKEFSKNNTSLNDWKTGLNEYAYDFVIEFDATAVADILDIHNYLMKKNEK